MENRNDFSNPKDVFLSMVSVFFFITIINGCLKYKNKEKPKTGPITICVSFYNSI